MRGGTGRGDRHAIRDRSRRRDGIAPDQELRRDPGRDGGRCLAAAALLAKRFPYVGLIGSATKRARFAGKLRQIGVGEDDIGRLVCPIGLTEITDKAPAAIAAGIASQLLIRRDAIAAARSIPDRVAIAPDRYLACLIRHPGPCVNRCCRP